MAKKLTPEQIGKAVTEHAQQCAVFAWAADSRRDHPELEWLYAVPNGGDRDRVVAGRMKAEGVRSGVADMALPVARGPYHGLYIELKREDAKRDDDPTAGMHDEQIKFQVFVREQGYAGVTAYGWKHAVRVLQGYLALGQYHTPPAA
jgi:hypothetical protein